MIVNLDPKQFQLKNLMSDISERCYSAGWMTNLEYVLWDAALNGQRKYGHDMVSPNDIEQLTILSKDCNSWIYFDDQTEETAINLESWKIKFDKAVKDNPDLIERF